MSTKYYPPSIALNWCDTNINQIILRVIVLSECVAKIPCYNAASSTHHLNLFQYN